MIPLGAHSLDKTRQLLLIGVQFWIDKKSHNYKITDNIWISIFREWQFNEIQQILIIDCKETDKPSNNWTNQFYIYFFMKVLILLCLILNIFIFLFFGFGTFAVVTVEKHVIEPKRIAVINWINLFRSLLDVYEMWPAHRNVSTKRASYDFRHMVSASNMVCSVLFKASLA